MVCRRKWNKNTKPSTHCIELDCIFGRLTGNWKIPNFIPCKSVQRGIANISQNKKVSKDLQHFCKRVLIATERRKKWGNLVNYLKEAS